MTTDELIEGFEQGTLPGEAFSHARHVEAAWGYLRRHAFDDALERFSVALRRFATANGAPGKYDAALTREWFEMIAARMARDDGSEWRVFIARHPDLLQFRPKRATPSAPPDGRS